MLRLIGFLVMLSVGAAGVLAVDYTLQRQQALEVDEIELTIGEYVEALPDRVAAATSSAAGDGLPNELKEMLPVPPSGWTVRDTLAEDDATFLPRARSEGDQLANRLIRETTRLNVAKAEDVVALTYERGERRVVFMLARFADGIFTNPAAYQLRYELQTAGARFRALDSMTVRGLDITEDFLPDGAQGRLFIANVAGQIQLRILAPKRMTDRDLVPFLETLNVKAMNANVVDRVAGLGEIDVIAVASEMSDASREAYLADRAAREAAVLARANEDRERAAAAGPRATESSAPAEPDANCEKGAGGIKRCTIGQ